jgi:hypothetical protein
VIYNSFQAAVKVAQNRYIGAEPVTAGRLKFFKKLKIMIKKAGIDE